jgi:flavorubredoxin
VGADEPVFILRAQDRLAEAAIEIYRVLTASHGAVVAEDLQQEIDRFRGWSGDKKMPD